MQVDLYLVGMSVAILAVVPVDIALNIVLAVVEDHNCYNTKRFQICNYFSRMAYSLRFSLSNFITFGFKTIKNSTTPKTKGKYRNKI